MKEKLHTDRVIVVEGRYDAARLAGLTDAAVLTTDGFGIYTDRAKQNLLRQLARTKGLLLLTDPDAAGFRIRTYVTQLAGEQHVRQAYVPACPGKEKRKAEPGKEGLLGVEGIPDETLRAILAAALEGDTAPSAAAPDSPPITYTDLYEWGLSGTPGAMARKTALLDALGLPPRLSKKALVEVLNRLYTRDMLLEQLARLDETE